MRRRSGDAEQLLLCRPRDRQVHGPDQSMRGQFGRLLARAAAATADSARARAAGIPSKGPAALLRTAGDGLPPFERSHRSHRIAGDYPFEPGTGDPDQLLAKKGQVPFDALSLCRFSALRQRRLAGSDQLFDASLPAAFRSRNRTGDGPGRRFWRQTGTWSLVENWRFGLGYAGVAEQLASCRFIPFSVE